MIALGVIAAIIFLIAMIKVGVCVIWDNELTLRLVIGPFRFSLSSGEKDENGKKQAPVKASLKKRQGKKPKQKNPWVGALLSNWQELLELIGKVLHMPKVDPLVLKAKFGGEDPADSAINYGRAWAVIGTIMPFLERVFTIGRRDIDVVYDRDAKQMSFYAKVALTIRIGQGVRLAVSVLRLFLRLYKETKQTKKAVQM